MAPTKQDILDALSQENIGGLDALAEQAAERARQVESDRPDVSMAVIICSNYFVVH